MTLIRGLFSGRLLRAWLPGKVPRATMFWEPDEKSGYKKKSDKSKVKVIQDGLKSMNDELKKYKEECLTALKNDALIPVFHGDYEILWKFNNEEAVSDWKLTTDADHNEGKSKAEFILGPHKMGVFRGYLDTTVPKDGVVKSAGYCNIKSPHNMKSFQRREPYDWTDYTHLLVRLRGDGRNYQVVMQMDRYFDFQWNDTYQYPLFTRGGPYWQTAKIPFSKFYLAAKGRIQDKQEAVQKDKVLSLGITVADSHKGPFQLEIDYVGLIYDESHTQNFAYEMYELSPYLLN